MDLVVVSNRVSRGKANEPMTGGLAAALLPVVENSGAIWVGSSGRVREGAQKEPFAEIEALGAGALATLDWKQRRDPPEFLPYSCPRINRHSSIWFLATLSTK